MPLSECPAELLDMIFNDIYFLGELDDVERTSVIRLMVCSKRLYEAGARRLYRHVVGVHDEKLRLFARSVAENPDLRALVTYLWFGKRSDDIDRHKLPQHSIFDCEMMIDEDGTPACIKKRHTWSWLAAQKNSFWHTLAILIFLLPNLRKLTLPNARKKDPGDYRKFVRLIDGIVTLQRMNGEVPTPLHALQEVIICDSSGDWELDDDDYHAEHGCSQNRVLRIVCINIIASFSGLKSIQSIEVAFSKVFRSTGLQKDEKPLKLLKLNSCKMNDLHLIALLQSIPNIKEFQYETPRDHESCHNLRCFWEVVKTLSPIKHCLENLLIFTEEWQLEADEPTPERMGTLVDFTALHTLECVGVSMGLTLLDVNDDPLLQLADILPPSLRSLRLVARDWFVSRKSLLRPDEVEERRNFLLQINNLLNEKWVRVPKLEVICIDLGQPVPCYCHGGEYCDNTCPAMQSQPEFLEFAEACLLRGIRCVFYESRCRVARV
ncbi:hypothetical protein SBOR_7581 [Sclerotinia borealis F-4128]|uniref:Uncharacterized protein n=1 Tax=Sclerotinia borealis (strain F-4128) TaxID=1432307 RepID=W9CAZ6_SCLBF|nr:hypothetical protein SBOR_7581 [Sclerotinia borealis F-4128]